MKSIFIALCYAGLSSLGVLSAQASSYPVKPIRVVVPTAAGGGSDAVIRSVAQVLGNQLGQNVVVENRPGGTGTIGMQIVAKARPDGYTLVFGTISNFVTNVTITPDIPYDPVKDFAPISIFFRAPYLLTVPESSDVRSLPQLIEKAKSSPGGLSYATAGIGSYQHFLTEQFSAATGIRLLHVPYQGSAPALVDFLAGRLDLFFDSVQSSLHNVQTKKARALAIGSATRISAAPDIPTLAEQGYSGVNGTAWFGLFAPAGTPTDIVAALHGALKVSLENPQLRTLLTSTGAEVRASTPGESAQQLAEDLKTYKEIAKQANIRK